MKYFGNKKKNELPTTLSVKSMNNSILSTAGVRYLDMQLVALIN